MIDQESLAIELRSAAMARMSHFKDSAEYQEELRSLTKKALEKVTRAEDCLSNTDPKAKAQLIRIEQYIDYLGCDIDHIRIDFDLSSSAAQEWVVTQLKAMASSFSPKTVINLDKAYSDLLPQLYELGFFLDSTLFIGKPETALTKLGGVDAAQRFANEGCSVEKMATAEDIDEVVELKREIFTQDPELCWFYLNEGHQKADRQEMADQLDSPETNFKYLIRREGKLQGAFGFSAKEDIPWGKVAGMDFAFRPAIRGLGLGKAAYKQLFDQMMANGVDHYIGGTSNPAVLKMAKTFEREVLQYHIRRR